MADDTPTKPQESTKPAFHSLHDEIHNAFEEDKYHRARNHIGGLGHVSANDVFKNYKRSWLTPFFGSNEPEPIFEEAKHLHPCQIFSRDVHLCLEMNNNSFPLCQSRVAAFQHCLREFSM
ncbi:hypothetical protein N2W54_002770 [Lotmaria passim]